MTSEGESITIYHPGSKNSNAGPDFTDARIAIGNLEWRGSVEIHTRASGWNDHKHDLDAAYENVILHVVWENDKAVKRADGSVMPTLELKNRIDLGLWDRYRKLYTSSEAIPCSNAWSSVDDVIKLSMLDKTVIQRLETRAKGVSAMFEKNKADWEETCYQILMKTFGFKVNADPFLQLAHAIPYKILLRHIDQPNQVEALLFGQAGFLEHGIEDEYSVILKREYRFLAAKYGLESKRLHKSQWRFLRLRPSNFPTVRLAQLAAVMLSNQKLFSTILITENYKELYDRLEVNQSPYWRTHYQFGKESGKVPSLGRSSIQNIIINTVIPLLTTYSIAHDEQRYLDRALDFLQYISAENNKIIRQWTALGYRVKNAFDSQALIELYNSYCLKRRCLECNVGATLIRP